ncbi:MAG: hypothetical protein ACHQHN_01500 [Sphingobacteriales bacterium]
MKKTLFILSIAASFLSLTSWHAVTDGEIAKGSQPQVAADNKGVIRVVFGREDNIYCVKSTDEGVSFSTPVLVAHIPAMHLGMSRGPQLASSSNYSIITAMDKSGDIHWFKLNNSANQWKNMGTINDLKGSAPEGLMHIAADKKDNFYAVWLDIRTGKRNQIYFSSLMHNAPHWSKNILAYQSPDGHVCECCQPHISVNGPEVAIMFRNWLNGSRDLYVVRSLNSGASFAAPQKLGLDTWKLNGCPMDGGGINIDNKNTILTTWQRKGMVYFCEPGQPEVYIAKGRNCSISGGDNPVVAFHNNDTVKLMEIKTKKEITVGNGDFLKSVLLPGNTILCVWEQDNTVRFKKV